MRRACYVAYEVGYFLISLLSRIHNTVFYGGSMHQTYSARCHIRALEGSMVWRERERRVNRIFFWQKDHCREAWQAEVARALKTLARNEAVQ